MRINQVFTRVLVLWFGLIGCLSAESFQETEDITISPDFCSLYPLTVSQDVLAGAQPGQSLSGVPLGAGVGNYSWLTWQGSSNVPSIVDSLTPPGNSQTYRNPDVKNDGQLNVGDWVQGAPGVKNASQIRESLSALLGRNVIIPVWDLGRGRGANKDYHTAQFAVVRLEDYKLNGKGYISFTFERYTKCYNYQPVATSTTIITDEDTSVTFELPVEDADADELNVRFLANPEHGEISLDGTRATYTPKPNYFGEDALQFFVDDGEQRSDAALITLVVRPVNDAPVAKDGQSVGDEDNIQILSLAGSDIENDPLTFKVVTQPTHGTVSQVNGQWQFTSNANYFGQDQFTFVANDGALDSEVATYRLTIHPVNDPPIATDRNTMGQEDQPIPVTFRGQDIDGDPLTFAPTSQPSNGTLTQEGDTWVYTPAPNFFGSDQFVYRANDGELASNEALYRLTVEPVNDAPTAKDVRVETDAGVAVSLPLVGHDIDSDDLVYLVDSPVHGELSGTHPILAYKSDTTFGGTETLSYRVSDGELTSEPATIEVIVYQRNAPPEITSTPPESPSEGMDYTYPVQATDPDGDQLLYSLMSGPGGMQISPDDGMLQWLGTNVDYVDPRTEQNPWCTATSSPLDASLQPVLKWQWSEAPAETSAYNQVMHAPIAVPLYDTNGDGQVTSFDDIAIIFQTFRSDAYQREAYLRAVWAKSGQPIWSSQSADVYPVTSLAAADIDDDGFVEIVTGRRGGGLIAYSHDGDVEWVSNVAINIQWGGPAISDLDKDGTPEIIVGNSVFSNAGQLLWSGDGSIGDNGYNTGPLSFTADLDLDGFQEVVAGGAVYSHTGQLLFDRGSGFSAIGNFDDDNNPEIVVVRSGAVSLYNHTGSTIWKDVPIPGGGRGGAPIVADLTGDGVPEIGVAGGSNYVVLDAQGQVVWQSPTQDGSSQATGSSVFDFNADGRAEVAYADEHYLRVYDGPTGDVLYEVPNTSGTVYELPVIVDVDQDGHAEIVVVTNTYSSGVGSPGVRVFEDANDSWAATRSIWNQHAYNIHNINDDLKVPADPKASWLTHNTFRLNTFPESDAVGGADVTLSKVRFDDQAATLSAVITNRGPAPVYGPIKVRFFNDADLLIGSVSTSDLSGGQHKSVYTVVDPSTLSSRVRAVAEPLASVPECDVSNNETSAAVVAIMAEDEAGLFDTQVYTVSLTPSNTAPKISSAPFSAIDEDQSYEYQVAANDSDPGDVVSFVLMDGPDGLEIDPKTGLMNAPYISPGTHRFTIKATDLAGLSAEQIHTLTVHNAQVNEAPEIVSTSKALGGADSNYDYLVEVHDPNWGDSHYFALGFAPDSLTIDESTGRISGLLADQGNPLPVSNSLCVGSLDVELGANNPVVKWQWDGVGAPHPWSKQVMHAPIAVPLRDTDGNGRLDSRDDVAIIFQTFGGSGYNNPGYLRAVSGKTGQLLWTSEESLIKPGSNPAAADLDGDGFTEIVTVLSTGGIIAYSHDGKELWRGGTQYNYGTSGPTIADLDADGSPEIIVGRTAFDSRGNLLFQGNGPGGGGLSVVADIDLDGEVEIVAGGAIYSNKGVLEADNGAGTSAIGNFDEDLFAEIVKIHDGKVSLYNHDGTPIWEDVLLGASGGGTPTVADLTGDGAPEIGVATSSRYVAIRADGSIVWHRTIRDYSSQATGSSVFDFDADGRVEVVYADEYHLWILDGPTGAALHQIPNGSGTLRELPVVADVDSDGHAEVVVVANNYRYHYWENGIRVFEDSRDSWAPTRSIWNQHTYHVNNINDDLTVPRLAEPSWLSHNTFRLNTFPDQGALELPDVIVSGIAYNDASEQIEITLKNRGLAPVRGDMTITVQHEVDGVVEDLGQLTDVGLKKDETKTLFLEVSASTLAGDIVASVTLSANEQECISSNNESRASVIQAEVTDSGGLSDQETYALYVFSKNHAPELLSAASSHGVNSEAYSFAVQAVDSDNGDALRFLLQNAPQALEIDPVSGRLRAGYLEEGTYSFNIKVTDLSGLSDIQVHTINVTTDSASSDNVLPAFQSSPVTAVKAGQTYHYQPMVMDGNGDPITLIVETGPPGLSLEGDEIVWQTTSSMVGLHTVTLTATDGVGETKQTFTVTVLGENQPPAISSTPTGSASVGVIYQYQLEASDANNDALSYELVDSPVGMSLSEMGLLQWTPDSSQRGENRVNIRVSDGTDSITQSFTVTVIDRNVAPSITSAPSGTVRADQTYQYAIQASDPEGDQLSYGLSEGPSGMSVTGTGLVEWTPTALQVGDHRVTVVVSDGRSTITQSFILQVNSSNTPPSITSFPAGSILAGNTYTYDIKASDLDGDPLTYELASAPGGMTLQGQQVKWTPQAADLGSYEVQILVSDGLASVEQKFTLMVTEANQVPVITSAPAGFVALGTGYVYQLQAFDPEGYPMTFRLDIAPPGMMMTVNGRVEWEPTASQLGTHLVRLSVVDRYGALASQSFTIEVIEQGNGGDNGDGEGAGPYLANRPKTQAIVGEQYRYRIAAVDIEGYTAQVELVSGPSGMNLDTSLNPPGLLWTPGEGSCSHTVTLRLTDYKGRTTDVDFTITVLQAPKKYNRIQCSKQNGACGVKQ